MVAGNALQKAIRLLNNPGLVPVMRAEPLPLDMSVLLQILARKPEIEAQVKMETDTPLELVRQAAEFYVEQMLFSPGADVYRTLASRPDASREDIRANMALLLRWLHPDSRGDDKNTSYFSKVHEAWEVLRSPESRAVYDQRIQAQHKLTMAQPVQWAPVRSPFVRTSASSGMRGAKKRRGMRRRWYRLLVIAILLIGLGLPLLMMATHMDSLTDMFEHLGLM